MTVTVDLEILRKVKGNLGRCLCKIGIFNVMCPCEEAFNLMEGKSCTCGLYRRMDEKT